MRKIIALATIIAAMLVAVPAMAGNWVVVASNSKFGTYYWLAGSQRIIKMRDGIHNEVVITERIVRFDGSILYDNVATSLQYCRDRYGYVVSFKPDSNVPLETDPVSFVGGTNYCIS